MTELEQKLQSTLKIQRESFKEELSKITKTYKQSLQAMSSKYSKVITDQQSIIEKQNQALNSYAEASKSIIEFKLEDQQLQSLKTQVEALEDQVLSLKTVLESEDQDHRDLAAAFRELQNGLESLEEKL